MATTTPTVTDFRGEVIAVGDRVIPIAWGDSVPLWLCNSQATVVGFGRTRVQVRYDDYLYDEGERPHTVPPAWLRRL